LYNTGNFRANQQNPQQFCARLCALLIPLRRAQVHHNEFSEGISTNLILRFCTPLWFSSTMKYPAARAEKREAAFKQSAN
jgi:hypothetical protein